MTKLVLLAGVYAGVQHFTKHNCIAIATICGLVYLGIKIKNA